jgi:hypothetical protein
MTQRAWSFLSRRMVYLALVVIGLAIGSAAHSAIASAAPPTTNTSGTATCATGGGTTCNVATALAVNFGANTGYTCSIAITAGTAGSTDTVTPYANTGSQVTFYVTGATAQTYVWNYNCTATGT